MILLMLGVLHYGYAKMALVRKIQKLTQFIFPNPSFLPASAAPRDAP
jgi:hypothetical protein